jgi:hypothetical protein
MKEITLGMFYGGNLIVKMPDSFDESKIDLRLLFIEEIEKIKNIANLHGKIEILERQITINL